MPETSPARPLLVALGSDAQALHLIHAACWAAREAGRPWVAVHVEVDGAAAGEPEQARLWLEEAEELGATVLWLRARTIAAGLLEATRVTGAAEILLGRGKGHWPWDRVGHSLAQELIRRRPSATVRTIALGPDVPPPPLLPVPGRRLGGVLGGIGTLAAATGVAALLPPEHALPAIFLIYLTATVFVAQHWGRGAGITALTAAAAGFDRLFAGPRTATPEAHALLVLLFLVILCGGQYAVALAERLDRQTRSARRRAARLAALLLFGRNLANAASRDQVAATVASTGERLLHRPLQLLGPEALAVAAPGAWRAGMTEPVIAGGRALLPCGAGPEPVGALACPAQRAEDLDEEARELLRAFSLQVGAALERVRWLEAAQASRVENEAERMRSVLLGSISHDLRTPLAAIRGAASSLLLPDAALPADTQRDLLQMIHDESVRLSHLLGNLLDLTRLESAGIHVHKEWQPLDEVIGAAIRRAGLAQGGLRVAVHLPDEPPLVAIDGALMEQLLINLLTNAHRHAPAGPVELHARTRHGAVDVIVADRGPGVPEEYRERIFEKFFRMPGSAADGGVGLGLAICHAIARAHGGSIRVEGRDGGGAAFVVTLPVEGEPPGAPAERDAGERSRV